MSKKSKMTENLKMLEEFDHDSCDSDNDEELGQMVQVNFEGFTAEEDDFHGIQRLLAQGFRGLDVNLSEIADLIITQNYVGCVIKEVIDDDKQAMDVDDDALEGEPDEESDFVFGLNTVINITNKKNVKLPCIAGLRNALLQRCRSSSAPDVTKKEFAAALANTSQHIGLLVNERLVNLPSEVALPAFETLQSEVEEANKIQMPFDFKYILLIAKIYKINTLKGKKKARKQKEPQDLSGDDGGKVKEVYANLEEEVLAQFASCSFEYCVSDCGTLTAESWSESEAKEGRARPWRRVLLLPADTLPQAVAKAKAQLATT